MGHQGSKGLDQSELITVAKNKAGLRVFAGFLATERRLVFVHGTEMNTSPILYTVLPTGQKEGPPNGKKLSPTREKGLITYPYVQHVKDPEKAKELLDTNCVWQDGENFPLVQLWTVNVNDSFRKEFDIKYENPDEKYFDPQAVANLWKTLISLFGKEEAEKQKVMYCSKKTWSVEDKCFLGTADQFAAFFEVEGVKEALDITSFADNAMEVRTLDKQKRQGTQTLRFVPNTPHVLYKRRGFTSFWCLKTQEQFEQDCEFEGEIGPGVS